MDLRDYIRILRKNWIPMLAFVIAGLAGGAASVLLSTPSYEARTQLYVSVRTDTGAATGDLVQGTTFARQMVTSYVDIIDTDIVLRPVIDELRLDTTASELAKKVSASAPLNTVLVDVAVTDVDPRRAARIADAVSESFADVVQTRLEKPSAPDAQSPVQITAVQPAVVPKQPTSPNVSRTVLLGALIGLGLGLAAAALRTMLDTRIHALQDVTRLTRKPLLGGIAHDPDAAKRPLIVHVDPRSPRAESFRTLRTNLQFLHVDDGPRTFVISSAGPGEGKSTTTANLAIALAETGARVALVDGDLRLPRVAEYLGIEGGAGLTDVLIGRVELDDVLQKWGSHQLFVLPAGAIPPNPSELLGSHAMDSTLEALSTRFDYVLVDSPPLLLVTDAAVLGRKTRGVIVVAAAGKTRTHEFEGAVRTLDTAGTPMLGVVVTMLPTKGPDSYGYGRYAYGSEPDRGPAAAETPQTDAGTRARSSRTRRAVASRVR